MFRTGTTRLLGIKPLSGLRSLRTPRPLGGGRRYINEGSEKPKPTKETTQPTKGTMASTKDRLWDRLAVVERGFGELLKEVYEREVQSRTDLATLKAAMRLLGWQSTAFYAATIAAFAAGISAMVYRVDKWEKYIPALVIATVWEKNLLLTLHPDPTKAPAPASKTPTK